MSPDAATVEIRKRLAAAPARVFGAFADPQLVSRWLKPAPEIGLDVLQLDFRVGGSFRFAYTVPGGQRMLVNGVYRTIEPPARIVFSWNIEPPDEHAGLQSEVTVSITPDGDGSELCIRHARLTRPGAAPRHAQGWAGAVEQLAALVTAGGWRVTAEDALAAEVRAALSGTGTISEIKMFGGLGFMLDGNMVAAVSKRGLLFRVGKDGYAAALARPGARPMEMRGRPIEGYIRVDPAALGKGALEVWLREASAYVATLPPKGDDAGTGVRATRKRKGGSG